MIPGIPLEKITPDVEPIQGEPGRFHVVSRTDARQRYLVDLFANGFVGKCGCPHFELRIQCDIDRGADPRMNQACYHLKRAERYFLEFMKRVSWQAANTRKTL